MMTRASTPASAGPWCVLALAMLLSGCSSTSGQICTALFAFVSTVAVDSAGNPVTGLVVSDTVVRTGTGFDVQQQGYPAGATTIFSDANLGSVREGGDDVKVTGVSGAVRFSTVFTFGSDGCHVTKLAGPDTVVVR